MLVVRLFWLQAALAVAQLPNLDDVLGGGREASRSAVEEQGAAETASPLTGILDGLPGNGILDPVLDPVVGPTGVLPVGEKNAAAPTTSVEDQESPATSAEDQDSPATSVEDQEPPATSSPDPNPDPAPTSVESVETSAPEQPTTQPTTETEQAPPVPVPTSSQPRSEAQQQQPATTSAAAPEATTEPAQSGSSSPAASEFPAPASSDSDVPASSQAPAASSTDQPDTATSAPGTSTTRALLPLPQETQSPTTALFTASGSTFLSTFIPPSPTAVNGAALNDLKDDSSESNRNTNPFVNPTVSDDSNPDLTTTQETSPADSSNPSPDTNALSTSTKIGIAAGVGGGTVTLAIIGTWLFWKRRMRRSPLVDDVEGGGRTTPQEKAKMDFESEHDVAFDFGAFLRRGGGGQEGGRG